MTSVNGATNATHGAAAASSIVWTWRHPRHGTLQTVIEAKRVLEYRQHPKDREAVFNEIGALPEGVFERVRIAATRALHVDRATHLLMPATDGESFECSMFGVAPSHAESVSALSPGMRKLREAVLAARRQAEGGRLAWRSLGGRIAWTLLPVVAMLLVWLFHDWRESNTMLSDGRRIESVVIERSGRDGYDKQKHITVQYELPGFSSQTTRISEFLSAENWLAAPTGARVSLLYHPTQGVFVAADIERFQRQKKYIVAFPLALLSAAFLALFRLPKYRIGNRADGDEYVVDGDAVVADDKDMPISRTNINLSRLLWQDVR